MSSVYIYTNIVNSIIENIDQSQSYNIDIIKTLGEFLSQNREVLEKEFYYKKYDLEKNIIMDYIKENIIEAQGEICQAKKNIEKYIDQLELSEGNREFIESLIKNEQDEISKLQSIIHSYKDRLWFLIHQTGYTSEDRIEEINNIVTTIQKGIENIKQIVIDVDDNCREFKEDLTNRIENLELRGGNNTFGGNFGGNFGNWDCEAKSTRVSSDYYCV